MLASNMSIEDSVYVIAQTLPICNVRHMAYSTFTIFQVDKMQKHILPNLIIPKQFCSEIDGVNLVTEGVVTIGKVLEIAQKHSSTSCFSLSWKNKEDGASLIAKMLFEEATDINFFVGKAFESIASKP